MTKPKRDPIMRRLLGKLRRQRAVLRDDRADTRRVRSARRKVAGLEARIAKVQARRKGLDHVSVLDGTPTTLGLKLVLLDARRTGKWHGTLTSGDRRTIIAGLLHRLGKMTQAELYSGWIRRLPGFAPANPPTRGTHLRLGDGVVGAIGEKLPWFKQGLDTSAGPELRRALADLGYSAYQPYPAEEWHTNLKQNPHDRLIERGLV